MKSTLKHCLLLISACHTSLLWAEGPSPASTKEWKTLSRAESNSLPCLDFNERSPYRVQVSFNTNLSTKRSYKNKDFLLTAKGLVPGKKGRDQFCQISISSVDSRTISLKSHSPMLASPLIARMGGFVDSRNNELKGCRINLHVQDSYILSLQCFVRGKGEATIGDLREALDRLGEISVLRYK